MRKRYLLHILSLSALLPAACCFGQTSACDSIQTFISSDIKNKELTVISDKKKLPQYPGGDKKLEAYIKKDLVLSEAGKNEYMIMVACFKIDCSGQVTEVEMLGNKKGHDVSNLKEVLLKMPVWIPAKIDGKNVNYWYYLKVKNWAGNISLEK